MFKMIEWRGLLLDEKIWLENKIILMTFPIAQGVKCTYPFQHFVLRAHGHRPSAWMSLFLGALQRGAEIITRRADDLVHGMEVEGALSVPTKVFRRTILARRFCPVPDRQRGRKES